jgi:hypothetical protein
MGPIKKFGILEFKIYKKNLSPSCNIKFRILFQPKMCQYSDRIRSFIDLTDIIVTWMACTVKDLSSPIKFLPLSKYLPFQKALMAGFFTNYISPPQFLSLHILSGLPRFHFLCFIFWDVPFFS